MIRRYQQGRVVVSSFKEHECINSSAPTRSMGSKSNEARKTKRTNSVRSGLRGEILLAALSLSACGSGSPSDKKTLRVDLDSWKQNSSGSLSLATANLSDPWFNTNAFGEELTSRLEFVLPDHTSAQNSFEVIEIPSSVREVVVNADGAHIGPKALILDFEPRGSDDTTPIIMITPSAQSDDLQVAVINEYALEVVGLSSVIISHDDVETLSSISGPVLSDITAVGDGALDILSTGQATAASEQAKLAFNSSGNNGSISITVTSRPGELDIVGTENSDVVTLYGNFKQGQYQQASVDQYANGSGDAYKVGGKIDFGAGDADTLVIYGRVDVRTLDLSSVEKLEVNSDLVACASQLISLEEITFTHNAQGSVSTMVVIDDLTAPITDVALAVGMADKKAIAESILSKIAIDNGQTIKISNNLMVSSGSSADNPAIELLNMEDGLQGLNPEYQSQVKFGSVSLISNTLDFEIDKFRGSAEATTVSVDTMLVDTVTGSAPTPKTPVDTTAPSAVLSAVTDDYGSVTGALTSGATTDDTSLVLSGTNEADSSVEVFNGSISLGQATVSGTSWSYTATVDDGTTYQFNVKETDAAGNIGGATKDFTVTVDTTAPSFTSGTTAPAIDENGSAGALVYTAVTTDASTVAYSLAGTDASAFTIDATTGAVNIIAPADYESKTSYSFNVIATDLAGNDATQTVTLAVNDLDEVASVIDLGEGYGQLIAPVAVQIAGVDRVFYYWDRDGSGEHSGDDRIRMNDGEGVVTNNHLVGIFNGGSDTTNVIGTRTATINGVEVRLPTLGDPNHSDGTDSSLQESKAGTAVSSGAENQTYYDGLLAIWDAHNGNGEGTGSYGAPTDWAYNAYWSASSSVSGSHAGLALFNGFALSDYDAIEFYVALEVVAPTAPTLTAVADTDNGAFDQGFTVTEGADVVVTVDGGALNSTELAAKFTITTASGVDTYTANANAFDGSETITVDATQTDTAGNQSAAATTLSLQNIDTTAPIQPRFSVNGKTLTIPHEEGAMFKVLNGSTDVTSKFNTTPKPGPYPKYDAKTGAFDGEPFTLTITLTDSAGNETIASNPKTVTIDTTAPSAVLSAVTDDYGSVTGALTSGATTDDTSLVLSGTNEADSSVEVFNGSISLGQATVSGTSWSYTATVDDGTTYQFNVKETDDAGNIGGATKDFTVTVDTTAPSFTSGTTAQAIDENGSAGALVYTAAATDASTVAYSLAGTDASAFTIDATTGAVNIIAPADYESKTSYSFNVIATDLAGNDATQTVTLAVNDLDEVAPTADISFSNGSQMGGTQDDVIQTSLADVDGDGDVDLIGVALSVETFVILQNDGGDFSSETLLTGYSLPQSTTTGDLDGDGDIDFVGVVMGDESPLYVFENIGVNGVNEFTITLPQSTVNEWDSSMNHAEIVDIDGDGDNDLVSSAWTGKVVLFKNVDGLDSGTEIGGPASHTTAADINGDNRLDLVSSSYHTDKITIYLQNENGTFSEDLIIDKPADTSGQILNRPIHTSVGDLNGDGNIDLVTTYNTANKFTVFKSNGSGGFHTGVSLDTSLDQGASHTTLADLNNDGHLDIVTAARFSNAYAVFKNDGSGNFLESLQLETDLDAGAKHTSVADIDGDGDLDIVGSSRQSDAFVLFENTLLTDSGLI
jgi:hypothetical protein